MTKRVRNISFLLLATLLLVGLLRGCVFTTCLIPSTGMENTLLQGDRILVNKWSYGLRLPLMSLWGYHRWGEKPVQREDIVVFNNPANRRQSVISKREIFTGRCVGLPGDTLLVDSLFALSREASPVPDRNQLYAYPSLYERRMDTLLRSLQIPAGQLLGRDTLRHIRSFSRYEYYLLEQAIGRPCWLQPIASVADSVGIPLPNLHPLVIPRRGVPVEVTPLNRTLLCNTLLLHEGRRATVQGDTLFIDGRPATHCTFTQDYYWASANNSINLADSRLFGLVPHSHLIGRAAYVWFSKVPGSNLFEGFRWERFGKRVE